MGHEWAEKELAGIDLGDARLNKRSVTLLDRLADKSPASIPHACNGWAETQAAYRFLAQEDIGWEDILAPHFSCTQQRMQGRPVVLCIQDTTELNFNGQQTEGLGTLSFAAQRGMYLHPIYAVSPEREPLGVLDAWMWVWDASKTARRDAAAARRFFEKAMRHNPVPDKVRMDKSVANQAALEQLNKDREVPITIRQVK
jgi:hypothetical protein